MEDVRKFEQSLKEDRQQFLQQTKRLKQERDEMEQQLMEMNASQQAIQRLYE